MTTAALQTQLPVADEMITVLMDTRCARHELRRFRMDEDGILAAARAGFIEWAFDISNGEQDRRMELRFLPAAIKILSAGGGTKKLNWSWDRVAKEIIRGATRTMTVRDADVDVIEGKLARLVLNCSQAQLYSFIPHQLKLAPGTSFRTGPNGTAQITTESFLEFLRKRRIK